MSKVKVDKNGRIFVIINGGVYRPEVGPHEYPVPQRSWGKGVESKLAAGADVQIKNVSQSPFCKVRTASGNEELWIVHGYDVKKPEACFFAPQAAKVEMPKPNWLPHQLVAGEMLVGQLNRPCMKG